MSAAMSDQSNTNVAEFFSPGPGERLRAARLSMGFDLAKIASELHLTTPVVEALEADDFQKVGARVFVRGYLRNYARVVGMPVESVLRQFDEKWPDDGASHSMVRESPTLPADGGPSRGLAGAMTWLLILGLGVLFLMWWRGYLDEIVPDQIRSTSVAEDRASLPPADADDQMLPPLSLDDAPLPVDSDGGLRLPSRSPEEPIESEPSADPQQPTPGEPASTDAGSVELPAVAPLDTSAAEAVRIPTPPVAAGSAPAPVASSTTSASAGGALVVEGTRQIVMSFGDACWVDVRDSTRRFKLFGEIPKGSRRVLGGKPPYKLVIGNAGAVTITVNGKPFDLTRYAKGNVARFTLDP
jgi:cytoskeleton protein RodZ